MFKKLRTELELRFGDQLVVGRLFVGATPKLTEDPLDVARSAITKVCESIFGLLVCLLDVIGNVNS